MVTNDGVGVKDGVGIELSTGGDERDLRAEPSGHKPKRHEKILFIEKRASKTALSPDAQKSAGGSFGVGCFTR